MGRAIVFSYGLISYFIGVAGLAAIILAYADLIEFGFLFSQEVKDSYWVICNASLIVIWGILHSGMARDGFKRVVTSLIPGAAERATYVLVAGITSLLLIGYWIPGGGQVWSLSSPLSMIVWVLFGFGWVFLLASTFAINHFDLFGLRQVFAHFTERDLPPVAFVRRAMYAYIRHPIQTGVLIGIWMVPNMTLDKLLLSIGFSLYIFIGLWFEERDLERRHPEEYGLYKQEVGKLFPRLGQARSE